MIVKDYDLHVTNYVLKYFKHLMSDTEKAADSAVVLIGHQGDEEEMSIVFPAGVDEEIVGAARVLLAEGNAAFRRKLRDRIMSDHRDEVFKNACPQCGKLPATPRASYCISCSHSWDRQPGTG